MDFGSAVIEAINNSDLENIKVKSFGYGDCFVEHGPVKELERKYKLDSSSICQNIKNEVLN